MGGLPLIRKALLPSPPKNRAFAQQMHVNQLNIVT